MKQVLGGVSVHKYAWIEQGMSEVGGGCGTDAVQLVVTRATAGDHWRNTRRCNKINETLFGASLSTSHVKRVRLKQDDYVDQTRVDGPLNCN